MTQPGVRTCVWAAERNEAHPVCYGWGCERAGCYRKKQAAQRRKAELAAYRKFPGNDLQQARAIRMEIALLPMGKCPSYLTEREAHDVWLRIRDDLLKPLRLPRGHCSWCEGEIYKPGAPVLNLRRGWHDGRGDEPNCLLTYYQHTRHPEQFALILDRDGTRCADCGVNMGKWHRGLTFAPARVLDWGGSWPKRFPPDVYVGDFTTIHLGAALEVDHNLALGLVVLTIEPAERWKYFGPMNLIGRCRACHAAKTKEDVRLIKAARKEKLQ